MMKLLGVVVTIALVLAAHAVGVESLHDRELFTPPPDAVAEAFTREVIAKRWDQAREYLAEPVAQPALEELQSQLEEGENVDCELTSRDDEKASVEVRVGKKTLAMEVEWREGEWEVARFPQGSS